MLTPLWKPRNVWRILVVDDEEWSIDLLRGLLEPEGYCVEEARTGEQALALLREQVFDLVLLDLLMPGFNGLETCWRIRNELNLRTLPVVFITSQDQHESRLEAIKQGGNEFLTKPVDNQELLLRVRNLLRLREHYNTMRGFQLFVENIQDILCVLNPDHTIRYVSPSIHSVLGYDPATFVGEPMFTLIHPHDHNLARDALMSLQKSASDTIKLEYRVFHQDGTEKFLEAVLTNAMDLPGMEGFLVLSRDMTERRQMEDALRASEERYALATRGTNDGIWDWDTSCEEVYFSPRWKQIIGLEEEASFATIHDWCSRVHPDDLAKFRRYLDSLVDGQVSAIECEHRLMHEDGGYRWVNCRATAVRIGQVTRVAGSLSDVTRHRVFDQITHFPNRFFLEENLRRRFDSCENEAAFHWSVVVVGLDDLPEIRVSLGDTSFYRAVVQCGNRVAAFAQREQLIFAKLEESRFALAWHHGASAQIEQTAQQLLSLFAQPIEVGNESVYLSPSIGISTHTGDELAILSLIQEAETAQQRAHGNEREKIAWFSAGMRSQALTRLQLNAGLRRALEEEEFWLAFQPIYSLTTATLDGFEALLRWSTPDQPFISPGQFIPVAEESGLIIPIGWWVLQKACQQMKAWLELESTPYNLSVNVNLSVKQIEEPDFVARVLQTLEDTGLHPRHLKLEVTESALLGEDSRVMDDLHTLREMGIRLCLDDFGTGYSSLSYLHRYEMDTLKIDRAFISSLGTQDRSDQLVPALLSLARALRMQTVAEGVETLEQLQLLQRLNCEAAQGYFLSRPLPAEEATRLLLNPTLSCLRPLPTTPPPPTRTREELEVV